MIIVDRLFALLATSWLPWLLAFCILLLALILWQSFLARLRPLRRSLARAIELVDKGEGTAGFKQRFPAIFAGLAEDPVLGRAWRSYAASLTAVPGNDQAIGAPRPPRTAFDDRLLARVGLNLRFYQAVPNMLVGLGLLFTFMGLVAALHFASAGVTAADIREAQGALRELLAAATFKFVTSIAGLAASLVFSWREKVHLHAAQAEIRRFCALLEERLVPLTPEGLMVTQIEETRRINQRLVQLGRSLIVRVPEGVEARLADELTLATRPLKAALERVARRFETLDERVAGELVEASRAVRALTGHAARLAESGLAAAGQPAGGQPAVREPATSFGSPAAGASPSADGHAADDQLTEERAAALAAGEPGEGAPFALALLRHRLGALATAVQDGLERLRGQRAPDRPAIEAMLVTTRDRVREARHALNMVAEILIAQAADDEVAEEARRLLGQIDANLKQSRSALEEAAAGLAAERRGA